MENLQNFEHLSYFFGICCKKIIPLIYDDALSYYEVLCRLKRKINEIIDTVNGLIDADIEGYLKNLIDEYATERVRELINEIAEPIVREYAETICREYLDNFFAEYATKIDNKLNNSSYLEACPAREYWFDGWDSHILTGVNQHKADSCLIDANNYYIGVGKYIFEVDKASYAITPHEFPDFTGSKIGHVTHNDTHIVMSDGDNRLYFVNKSTSL